jgi:hypothetical protein
MNLSEGLLVVVAGACGRGPDTWWLVPAQALRARAVQVLPAPSFRITGAAATALAACLPQIGIALGMRQSNDGLIAQRRNGPPPLRAGARFAPVQESVYAAFAQRLPTVHIVPDDVL